MTGVSREVPIDAPKDKVWATLANLGAIQNYNPMVARSYYTSDTRTGVGANPPLRFLTGRVGGGTGGSLGGRQRIQHRSV